MVSKFLRLMVLFLMMFGFSTVAQADDKLQCLVTVTKNAAWSQESVVVNIVDFATKKTIQSIDLTAATKNKPSVNSITQAYDCKYPVVQLFASYTPSIWSSDKGKIYPSKNIYDLTQQILAANKKGIKKLEITATFPDDFIGVPLLVTQQ